MTRVLLDLSPADGPPTRLVLDRPVAVLTATTLPEVRPAIEAVEQGARSGLTAAGWITYEAAPAFEPRMRVRPGGRLPLLWFALFDEAASRPAGAHEPEPARPNAHPGNGGPPANAEADPVPPTEAWQPESDRAAHAAAVAAIREHIAAGRTYQANLTTRLRAPFTGDPRLLWERMRRAQGPGYHAFFDTGPFVVASSSPELFFRTRGREILTRPMKGTRPRGRHAADDAALRDDLARSPKDRAENLMIVDLLRNDLGRVAVTGSVRVPRLLEVERYRTVWQMTSTVTATLTDDVGLGGILAALFPCGSVTGAPKISTMDIIADLELSPREVYCGAIGLVGPGENATFTVPIRTAWIDRERGVAEYGAGGGVVWESTPDGEYDELLAKAAVVRAPWPEFRLLETLRIEDGVAVRRARHLARMRASADHFGFPFPAPRLEEAVAQAAREAPSGVHRLRLLLDERGRVEARVEPLGEAAGDRVGSATAPPRPVALATGAIVSTDRFLHHKTTRRDAYDRALAAAPPGAWDVILVNERGEPTELTRGNLVVALDGLLLTPPLDAGLLPGCLRAELLEDGVIREAALGIPDLHAASRLWLVNSLRGWVPLALMEHTGPGPGPAPARDLRGLPGSRV